MTGLSSIRHVLLVAMGASGCSLLAPSRDELSGGKNRDSSVLPDTGAAGGDEGGSSEAEGGSTFDATDGALDVTADAGESGADAPTTMLDCGGLGAVGKWDAITPPEVILTCPPDQFQCGGNGTEAFVLDPLNGGTIYLGTFKQGLWKSTDCGTTWKQLNTGTNSTTLSGGVQSIFEIDPVDSRVMYTKGTSNAGFKSTNGGADWDKFWPPNDAVLSKIVQYNQVGAVSIDPTNHQHLIVTFGDNCAAPYDGVCYAESKDSAATWTMTRGRPEWKVDSESHIWIVDAMNWVYSAPPNGLWRSDDLGVTWKQLADVSLQGARGRLHHADDGSFFLGSRTGILRSRDGLVWALNKSLGLVMAGAVSDGNSLYLSTAGVGFDWGKNLDVYYTSPLSDGMNWSKMAAPGMTQGGMDLAVDRQHHVLYSSNAKQGFWRVVTQ